MRPVRLVRLLSVVLRKAADYNNARPGVKGCFRAGPGRSALVERWVKSAKAAMARHGLAGLQWASQAA